MEPGQFGDGLMVRGNHRILAGKPEDVFGMKFLEENMLMRPQIFFWKGKRFNLKWKILDFTNVLLRRVPC